MPPRPQEPEPAPGSSRSAPRAGSPPVRFLLGSRAADLAAFALLLTLLAAAAPFLRVYHRIVAVDVTIVRIGPDGELTTLPATRRSSRGLPENGRPATVRRWLERSARELLRDRAAAGTPAGTRYRITARWSENSLRLDRQVTIVTDAVSPAAAQPGSRRSP